MSTKRKLNDVMKEDGELLQDFSNKKQQVILNENKHSLDSDEDDSEDDFDHMDNHEIEGEEDCEIFKEGEVIVVINNSYTYLIVKHTDAVNFTLTVGSQFWFIKGAFVCYI